MDHRFKIDGIRLREAHFAINQHFKWVKHKSVELQHGIEIGYKKKDKILHVLVTVSSDSEDQPFRFSVAWEGSFAFEEMPQKDALDRIVHINCAAIIYPYIRESVADLTRRAGIPPLNLEPFNFIAMYEDSQKASSSAPRKLIKRSKK